ncbi:universal stress protein [Streptomyces sp. NPDC091376]|uniref:universal stress protein n=1 Tax=Streptomyces sp. NPDC091376 TaxID=3365994 RepID=UPI003801D99E
MVGTNGTLGSLTALHRAAAEARTRDVELLVVLAWLPPGTGLGSRRCCDTSLLAECRAAACERLREILDTVFGESRAGVTPTGLTVRGTPGAALVDAARDSEDLIVVGTGSRGPLLRALRPSVARYCLAHAPCPVLAVPPSPLQGELGAVHRRNMWRMPLDARELAQ